ncbi:hypothetical protein JNJ66_03875 [Candidatus Saccharibacteria bacterium]|nr:hypothetical protein [Candidatus Saccharibacteria bacterium]
MNKKTIILCLTLFVGIMAVTIIYYLVLSNLSKVTKPSSANDKSSSNASDDSPSQIKSEDVLQQVEKEAKLPEGWRVKSVEQIRLHLATPAEWTVNSSEVPKLEDKPVTHQIIARSPSHPKDHVVFLKSMGGDLTQQVVLYEKGNTGDDGLVESGPAAYRMKILTKDTFTYDDKKAVRYTVSRRLSNSATVEHFTSYLIQGKTYTYALDINTDIYMGNDLDILKHLSIE